MVKLFRILYFFIILFIPFKTLADEVRIIGVIYQFYEGERLIWKMKAQEFIKDEEKFLGKKLYLENLSKGLKIVADEGIYWVKEEKFVFKGMVQVFTEREGDIFTDLLFFYPKKDLLLAPNSVLVKKGNIEIVGEDLSYDLSKEEFKLKSRSKAQFKL